MRRLIAAGLVLATLALSVPADAHAGGFLGRIFGRGGAPAQRNFSFSIGGGRGLAIQRQVVRAQPVVVQQPAAFQVVQQKRIVQQQQFAVPVYQQQVQVQQFAAPAVRQQFAVGVGGY